MTTSRTRLDGVQRRSRPRLFLAALWPATFLHQHRREPSVVQARAEANIALAGQQRFALWLAVANILHGWALAVQERPEAGLEQMQRGLEAWRAAGANLYVPYFLTLVAEGLEAGGRLEEARRALAEAEALVGDTEERWWEAEKSIGGRRSCCGRCRRLMGRGRQPVCN